MIEIDRVAEDVLPKFVVAFGRDVGFVNALFADERSPDFVLRDRGRGRTVSEVAVDEKLDRVDYVVVRVHLVGFDGLERDGIGAAAFDGVDAVFVVIGEGRQRAGEHQLGKVVPVEGGEVGGVARVHRGDADTRQVFT